MQEEDCHWETVNGTKTLKAPAVALEVASHTNMTYHYQPFAMVNQNLFSHQFYWLLSDEGWKNEHIMTLALKISLTKGIIHAELLLTDSYHRPKLTSHL